ncbi:MAG: glutaredoxin family protein [Micrococcales bacterium]
MKTVALTLIGKPGCHLCDDAELAIAEVLEEFATDTPAGASPIITFKQLNMLESDELTARYHDEIPVLLIDGKVHNYWRIDKARLRAALEEASK